MNQKLRDYPDIVGRYRVGDRWRFHAVLRTELDRTAHALASTLATFHLPYGSFVLTVSLVQEIVHFAPFEHALMLLGLLGANAEASVLDAARVESNIRQFKPAAICGVAAETLEGLRGLGHDPSQLFAGKVVWARPDAWPEVQAMRGVDARRCVAIGPAFGLQCARGDGVHIDGREWVLEEDGGELLLSSRLDRFEPVSRLATGVHGRIAPHACCCGVYDPRVLFD